MGAPDAATTRFGLLVPWTLNAETPGVVYAEVEDGPAVVVGQFKDHLLAADAVCAHNAVLEARPT